MTAITDFLESSIYAPGTVRAYRAGLIDFFSDVYEVKREGRRATRAETERYEELSDQYLAEVKSGKRDYVTDVTKYAVHLAKVSPPKTVHLRISVIKEFLRENRLKIEDDDNKRITKKLGTEKRRPTAISETTILTRDTIKSIVMQSNVRMRAFILVLLSSGMRIGEALQLLPSDIDLSQKPAKVRIRREITKTKVARETFISTEAVESLNAWMKVRDRYIKNARERGFTRSDSPYLFAMSRTGAYRNWDEAVRRAGLFKRDNDTGYATVRIHSLRKYFRSHMALTTNPELVEAWIGHSGGLNDIYARHFTPEKIAEEYQKGEHLVTIFSDIDLETRKKVDRLEEENKRLMAELANQNQKMEEIAQKYIEEKIGDIVKLYTENRPPAIPTQ
jgi:integrase